jgi:hypothetical protein
MAARKRSRTGTALQAMPLSELPIMKALMGLPPPTAGSNTLPKRASKEEPKAKLATLMATIVDKLQVLALRRPLALIIVAQVLDGLLKRQLDVLDDDLSGKHIVENLAKTRIEDSRPRRQRFGGR